MEYHANGRWWCITASDMRQALACQSVKLIFKGSWALLLNNNSREKTEKSNMTQKGTRWKINSALKNNHKN